MTEPTPERSLTTLAADYLTSPEPVNWPRLAAASFLAVLGMLLTLIWMSRDGLVPLISSWSVSSPTTVVVESRAPAVLARLLKVTGARVAIAYTYNINGYLRHQLHARTADGREIMQGYDDRPITTGAGGYGNLLANLLAGDVPCYRIDSRAAGDIRLLVEQEGVAAFCVGGIPPSYGVGLRGSVVVLTRDLPTEDEAASLRIALRAASAALSAQ